MGEIPNEDKDLAERARVLAGGPANLARRFGVSKQAVNDWGRRRGIPRHLRESIREYVVGSPPAEPTARPTRRKGRLVTDAEGAMLANGLATAMLSDATADETEYLLTKLTERVRALIDKRRAGEAQ